jgi:hypothetical protein
MAKTYYAATAIKFGKRTENGSAEGSYEQKKFAPGDKVEGLAVEDMKGLWNAGALTTEAPAKDENDSDDEKPTEEKSSEEEASTKTKTSSAGTAAKTPTGSAAGNKA